MTYPVCEIFGPTIQGEGRLIGTKTSFIRFWGCDSACTWCDTKFARDPEERIDLTLEEILGALTQQGAFPAWVTLTGGNPLLHDLDPLVVALHQRESRVNVETQGTLYQSWAQHADVITVSPKPPSAGGPPPNLGTLALFMQHAQADLKIVVFDEKDLEFARVLHNRFPWASLVLQAGDSSLDRLDWLVQRTTHSPEWRNVIVLPQLHVLLWGHRRRV